jgi:hypothetical protein
MRCGNPICTATYAFSSVAACIAGVQLYLIAGMQPTASSSQTKNVSHRRYAASFAPYRCGMQARVHLTQMNACIQAPLHPPYQAHLHLISLVCRGICTPNVWLVSCGYVPVLHLQMRNCIKSDMSVACADEQSTRVHKRLNQRVL